jgi:ABC-2 type transport system ATP-binding protein
VILSTHLLGEIENVCDRVEIMQQGRLIYGGSSASMMQYGNGKMTLEEVFLDITENHAAAGNSAARNLAPENPVTAEPAP